MDRWEDSPVYRKILATLIAAVGFRELATKNIGNINGQKYYILFLDAVETGKTIIESSPELKATYDSIIGELETMIADTSKGEFTDIIGDLNLDGPDVFNPSESK